MILSCEDPAARKRGCKHLKDSQLVEVAGKRLFAGFVPEHRTARICADGAPDERPCKQRPLGYASRALLGADLVESEQHECPYVDERKGRKGIGESEEGGNVHAIIP